MADDVSRPDIDPALVAEARASGVDVETLIERALRREIAARRTPAQAEEARRDADAVVAAYNERFDRDGAWIEAWRHWQ